MAWKHKGELIPLLYRLVDDDPSESAEVPIKRIYSVEQLRASILQEVFDLLDTRLTLDKKDYDDTAYYEKDVFGLKVGYPYFYGISDFSFYDASNSDGISALEDEIKTAIEIFEPRLKNVDITLAKFAPEKQDVEARLQADLVVGDVVEPLTFPIRISGGIVKKIEDTANSRSKDPK